MYKFVFANGTAKIQTDDGVDVIVQPFYVPPFGDGVPWESAEQAEQWMREHFAGMLEGHIAPPSVADETSNTTPTDETSVTGE